MLSAFGAPAPEVKNEPPKVALQSGAVDQDAQWEDFKNKYPDYAKKNTEAAGPKLKRRPSSENVTFQQYADKHKAQFDKVLELEISGA